MLSVHLGRKVYPGGAPGFDGLEPARAEALAELLTAGAAGAWPTPVDVELGY